MDEGRRPWLVGGPVARIFVGVVPLAEHHSAPGRAMGAFVRGHGSFFWARVVSLTVQAGHTSEGSFLAVQKQILASNYMHFFDLI